MLGTPQDAYLESNILTADSLELVRMLYRAAADAVRRARLHLAARRISERSSEISRALALLCELSGCLDHARGGSLSRSLVELYDYMQRRLLEANMRQKAEPLAEVESLLATLLEGWERIHPAEEHRGDGLGHPDQELLQPSRLPYAVGPQLAADAAVEYAGRSWSL
jgi:flagellar protein FliS